MKCSTSLRVLLASLRVLSLLSLLCLWLVLPVAGQAKDLLVDIAPLLTAQHMAVVRADVASLDVEAGFQWLDEAAKKAGMEKFSENKNFIELKFLVSDFTQAGGRVLYVLLGGGELAAVTLGEKADTAALAEMFGAKFIQAGPAATGNERFGVVAMRHAGLLLIGQRATLDRAIAAEPVERPDLAKAMAAAGDAPLTMAVVLPRAMIQQMMDQPKLPDELGGGETAPLGQLEWGAVSVTAPPKISCRVTISCESADGAKKFKALWEAVLKGVETTIAADRERNGMTALGPSGIFALLCGDLTYQVRDNAVVGSSDEKKILAMVAKLVAQVDEDRAYHQRRLSEINIRLMSSAMFMYSAKPENNQQYPPDLETLVKDGRLERERLDNPRMPDRVPGYVYVRPTKTVRDYGHQQSKIIFVYENYDTWPRGGIAVGFLGQNVEVVKDEAAFKKLLDATREANK